LLSTTVVSPSVARTQRSLGSALNVVYLGIVSAFL
jgi:hypothetical protein